MRIQGERVDLLGMQVAMLHEEKRKTRRLNKKESERLRREAKKPVIEQFGLEEIHQSTSLTDPQVMFDVPFLPEWNVYWTTRFFSSTQNHLVNLDGSSRSTVLEEVKKLGQGQISIRPQSILSALEFHLRKDVVQRALSMRNKYGPDGIKDWVKIKRGSDRIFLLVSEGVENQLVFFAAGRDVVYRGI